MHRAVSICTLGLRAVGDAYRRASVAAVLLAMLAFPLQAAQVRVHQGTLVRLRLHYDLTSENVLKGDRVEFDVADNVMVNNQVVIAKGAGAWGQVTKVKSEGRKRKKHAKDAMVAFRFVGVRAADNQEIPLRILPHKPKKVESKENEIEENSPMRGLRERMIGAEKGKEYAAYTDADALVNSQEAATVSAPAAAGQPLQAAPAAGASTGPTSAGSVPTTPPAVAVPADPASISFASEPAGAEIVIDGNFVGNTPSTLRVAAGRHVIELRLSGYQSWTRTMTVAPASTPSIRATLEKQ